MKSAERITTALYSSSPDSLTKLSTKEFKETFRDASLVEILLEPATSVLDMVMKAKCFANESKNHIYYLWVLVLNFCKIVIIVQMMPVESFWLGDCTSIMLNAPITQKFYQSVVTYFRTVFLLFVSVSR